MPKITVGFKAVNLGVDANVFNVGYRNYIETPAGKTRNDIFSIHKDGSDEYNVLLTVVGLPTGIVAYGPAAGVVGNTWEAAFSFVISSDIKPSQYDFKIDIQIDGTDYGTVPCTIKVTK